MKGCNVKKVLLGLWSAGVCVFLLSSAQAQEARPASDTAATTTAASAPFMLKEYSVPQPAAQNTASGSFVVTVIKFAFTLAVVLFLVYVTVYALKMVASRYGIASTTQVGMLESIDSLPLGPQKVLHLVRVHTNKVLVLAVTEKEIHVLEHIDNPQAVSDILSQVKQKWSSVKTFKEHFDDAQKKKIVQASVGKYLNDLKQFLRGLKSQS